MPNFDLDPSEGPHAASKLTDSELELLHRIVSIELAIRLGKDTYRDLFQKIAESRAEMDEIVCDLRNQRDRMVFVASVEADIEQLRVLGEDSDDVHGLYL